MGATRLFSIALLLAALPAGSAMADHPPRPHKWEFAVTLDGKAIGTHVFTLSRDRDGGKTWHLASEADFTATFIGVPVYRYRHRADESWDGDCLAALTADTDDDGDMSHVVAEGSPAGGKLQVAGGGNGSAPAASDWKGCLMNFAYWNPAMRKQKHLLNPQTGDIEDVTITRRPPETVAVHGQDSQAQVWRVAGRHEPVDMLYGPDGEWIGLNATVNGGYALAYRLQ